MHLALSRLRQVMRGGALDNTWMVAHGCSFSKRKTHLPSRPHKAALVWAAVNAVFAPVFFCLFCNSPSSFRDSLQLFLLGMKFTRFGMDTKCMERRILLYRPFGLLYSLML
jgi:hypothetical protein